MMSRQLPPHASLEHLRKQAKGRARTDGKTLADAQHAVAQEYGFGSWARLKGAVLFSREWRANVDRSQRHPLNQYQAAALRFEVAGDVVTVEDLVIDDAGRPERTRNVLYVDGQARHTEHGYVVTSRWRGARALQVHVSKDGEPEGELSYEVSEDGKTLKVTTGEQVGIFEAAT
jgi:hypothetical protein